MALETLKGLDEIGGYKVMQERPKKEDGSVDWDKFDEMRKDQPIYVDHAVNTVSFRIQDGPIKENGVNGCQVDTLMHTALRMISVLNEKFPCRQNSLAITKLEEAIHWLDDRKKDREKRGVEGYNKK